MGIRFKSVLETLKIIAFIWKLNHSQISVPSNWKLWLEALWFCCLKMMQGDLMEHIISPEQLVYSVPS